MSKDILVTDSLFMAEKHMQLLRDAGYNPIRLDKPEATEDELIQAIKGKVGYILGGTEIVTEKVIDAADELKVICFTGVDYGVYIPSAEYAKSKGIEVKNAPNGPSQAVAEWAVGAAIAMNRHFFELGKSIGNESFMTTPGLEGQKIGIVGLGHVGQRIAQMIKVFRPDSISYWNRSDRSDIAEKLSLKKHELNELFQKSDVIFGCLPASVEPGFFSKELFAEMMDNSLFVSIMHIGPINEEALYAELKAGRLRGASDWAPKYEGFNDLPLSTWFAFNGTNAFNTVAELDEVSTLAVRAALAVLSGS